MRLTIIPSDGAVYKDGETYVNLSWTGTPSNVHALQWFDDNQGWIEYKNGEFPSLAITELPSWVDSALDAWTVANTPVPPAPPTPAELQASNLETALQILKESDFTQLADVALVNKDEWATYRSKIREIAVNPPAAYITFPVAPNFVWN